MSSIDQLLDLSGLHIPDLLTSYVSQVRQSVSILMKLSEQRHKLPIVGERRVQVFNVTLDAVVNCLIIVNSLRRDKRKSIHGRACEWLVLIFECSERCSIDTELVLAKAGRLYLDRLPDRDSEGQVGIKLLWSFGESLEQTPRLFKRLTQICRLSLFCHCFELLSLCDFLGQVPEQKLISQQRDNMIRHVLSWVSQCSPSAVVFERSAYFVHALGKVLQQVIYKSSESAPSLLLCSAEELAQVLSEATKLGWIVKEVHGSVPVLQNREEYLHKPERPFNPWRSAKLNIEVVVEFLLQKGDQLGVQGAALTKAFVSQAKNWSQLSQESHDNFLLQVSVVVLRCLSPHLVATLKQNNNPQEHDPKYLRGLLSVLICAIDISFKYDRHMKKGGILTHTLASSPYLSKQRKLRNIYLNNYEKNVVDAVGVVVVDLLKFATGMLLRVKKKKDLAPSNLRTAVNACFARIGGSDIHWSTIVSNSQLESEFEMWAGLLRCAIWSLLGILEESKAVNSWDSADVIRGILCAMHELTKNGAGSVQSLIQKSKLHNSEVAASGEYTIAIYAGRVCALALLLQKTRVTNMDHGRLAVLVSSLCQRSCNARLVHDLKLESLLCWVPVLAISLGDANETLGKAGGSALLGLVKTISVRGLMEVDDGNETITGEKKREKALSLDAICFRVMEIWHALFATGNLPAWMIAPGSNGGGRPSEHDPLPFSLLYSKDLMLMLTQQQRDWGRGAPEWFRPEAANRQLLAVQQDLEAELRATLMPFRIASTDNFIHASERTAYSLAGQLVLPRFQKLSIALTCYAQVWHWSHHRSALQSSVNISSLPNASMEAFFLSSSIPTSGGGHASSGALGVVSKTLQTLAEAFVSYASLRGRITAAYYTHLTAQLAKDAGDLWEAGNAFAMVANCIVGNPSSHDVDNDDYERTAEADKLHASIASLFLKESIQVFGQLGAGPEKARIQEILDRINPDSTTSSSNTSGREENRSGREENASSYYFCVGAKPSGVIVGQHHQSSVKLGPLNLVRLVLPEQKQNNFTSAENLLIERLHRSSGLRHIEGRLEWRAAKQWRESETSTLATLHFTLTPHLQPNQHSQEVLSKYRRPSASGPDLGNTFWIRRLWPLEVNGEGGVHRGGLLRCPDKFVLLPSTLDGSVYTEAWATGKEDTKLHDGQVLTLDRLVLSTVGGLTPLVSLCSLEPVLLGGDSPSLLTLLKMSSYGTPMDDSGKGLGPMVEQENDEDDDDDGSSRGRYFSEGSDNLSDLSTPPRPPDHPPPNDGFDEISPPPSPQKSVGGVSAKRAAALKKLELAQSGQIEREEPVVLMMPPKAAAEDSEPPMVLPPLPPKPEHLLPPEQKAETGATPPKPEAAPTPPKTDIVEPRLPLASPPIPPPEHEYVEFLNPVMEFDEGFEAKIHEQINVRNKHTIQYQETSSGIRLCEEDAKLVHGYVVAQTAVFSDCVLVEKNGVKDVTIHVFGPRFQASSPKRRSSLIQRAKRRDSVDDIAQLQKSSALQLWIGKSGNSSLISRRKSKTSFKLLLEVDLTSVSVDEGSTPGVIRFVTEDRQKRGENPILLQTDSPSIILSTIYTLQAAAASGSI